MLFNSMAFAIFMPIVFCIYWALPHKYRWAVLLVSSYYFYMSWNAKYVFLILFTTLVSYGAALLIDKANSQATKKGLLAGSLTICFLVLFIFKYLGFAFDTLSALFGLFAIDLGEFTLKLMLPVGISFYTFQTVGYVVDVYKGKIKPERHLGKYATFVSFFPQLVAGPIERTSNLLPQIDSKKEFDYNKATYGIKLMAWGFFKKMVVADGMSPYADVVFANVKGYTGFSLMMAMFLFTIQIYCDFSGYSDIAIGSAKLLGVDLMTNFKSPYFSTSIKEFWSRWHISLSTWFRDYVYIPLGGNRVGSFRHKLNLLITFLVSGLWHGANWTFVLWGGIHGAIQVLETGVAKLLKKESSTKEVSSNTGIINAILWWVKVLVVFLIASIAWVFFRAGTISDAFYVLKNMLVGVMSPVAYVRDGMNAIGVTGTIMVHFVFCTIVLGIYDYISLKMDVINAVSSKSLIARWIFYIGLIVMIMMLKPAVNSSQFIYFQF